MTEEQSDRIEAPKPLETLTLDDGRTLAFARYGAISNPRTMPVFYFNGTPSSRIEAVLLDEPAQKLGIPLIATDRPGFGCSTFQEGRRLIDWPKDILALADHLDIAKFAVFGLSGGGPHALACLHEIPRERLVAVTTVSSMWPTSFGMAGMMSSTRFLFWTAFYSTWAAETLLDTFVGAMSRRSDKKALTEHAKASLVYMTQPEVDKSSMREILDDSVLSEAMVTGPKEALRVSSRGAARELYALASDWGFSVQDVDAGRLTMWHGDLDVNVPFAMATKGSEMLPLAEFHAKQGEGHISLVLRHREDVLRELVERL